MSPRRYSVDLPDYTTRVRGGRKADLTSRMHFWSRIRHLDPGFLVSFRASPVASVVRGTLGRRGGPRGCPCGGEMGSHGPPQAPIF